MGRRPEEAWEEEEEGEGVGHRPSLEVEEEEGEVEDHHHASLEEEEEEVEGEDLLEVYFPMMSLMPTLLGAHQLQVQAKLVVTVQLYTGTSQTSGESAALHVHRHKPN